MSTFKLCERFWRRQLDGDGDGDEDEDLTDFEELRDAVLLMPAFELQDRSEVGYWIENSRHTREFPERDNVTMKNDVMPIDFSPNDERLAQ